MVTFCPPRVLPKKMVDLKCTKEGSRDGGDIPKILDNNGKGMSNIDNVIE